MSSSDPKHMFKRDLERHGGLLSEAGVKNFFRQKNAVYLESSIASESQGKTLVFVDPVEIIRARRVKEVLPALVRAQMSLEKGMYVAGYISYEAAPAFLPAPHQEPSDDPPYLLWFGVYRDVITCARDGDAPIPSGQGRSFTIGQIEPDLNQTEYLEGAATIRRYLEAGHSYQVNYTFPVRGRWSGSLSDLYLRLRTNQPVSYGSIITHDDCTYLSFSPELFFSVRNGMITLKPMKGTSPRGRTLEEDEDLVEQLRSSEKDRAENRMIVDLLRNDIGRIARPGSVRVRSFFDIEKYESILQATSTIDAELEGSVSLVDLFQALFPSGSVTGAPKIETMKIIHEVERGPRGVYTGAIGYAAPDGEMTFNVAIRTLQADASLGTFRLHVGSGVTIASNAENEYRECFQKSVFVTREYPVFELFETIRWSPDVGYHDLEDHLKRLDASARYFGWKSSLEEVRTYLAKIRDEDLKDVEPVPHRVRITYRGEGICSHSIAMLPDLAAPILVGFSKRAISTEDRFQYHKTTRREVYDVVSEEARARGWFDAIVFNERNEVAEGARSNVFIEKDGMLYTPPISAGILNGTMRHRILRDQPRTLERTILRDDVLGADHVFISNALRGLLEVEIVG